ncbi:division plane positioning ATPase MipZ [Piscirickettsia litoralis]|uniref:Cobyrinic acid ac-diamide synthase n=1 Tax=Piscirickettsia litoralis TaxID=1891921 RepID=A0ABX2ZXN8_9GAMM|nr:division plane positioning ATPase MipZ [Piscirickettsia litoralis]ODN40983.1 cobyrinic acid ac-diamide synthase [Piscirickettsia litoralis]
MIILLGSQKGGTGKSTLSVNICAELLRLKKTVLLIDADAQGTSNNWSQDRENTNNLPHLDCLQKYGNIRKTLLELSDRYDYIVVDTAGHDSKELRSGLTAADILLTPFKPSQPDLDTMARLDEIIEEAKIINEELKCFACLNMSPTNPVVNEAKEARKLLNEFSSISIIPTIIRERKAFRDTISQGLGVVETQHSKAKAEIQNLVNDILKELESKKEKMELSHA